MNKKVTPKDQLVDLLWTHEEVEALILWLEPLIPPCRDDLCLAVVAWLRFRIRRPFQNPVMLMAFESLIALINQNRSTLKNHRL